MWKISVQDTLFTSTMKTHCVQYINTYRTYTSISIKKQLRNVETMFQVNKHFETSETMFQLKINNETYETTSQLKKQLWNIWITV